MPSPPSMFEHLVSERYAELAAHCRGAGVVMHDDAGVGERVRRLLLASDFAFEALRADPGLLTASGLERLRDPAPADARVAALRHPVGDALASLRRFRRAEAVRLVFRDVNGLDEVADTLAGTTALYEVLIEEALRIAARAARARHGTPRNPDGAVQSGDLDGEIRAEHADRHRQQYRDGDSPAFIKRHQEQVGEQHGKSEDDAGLAGGRLLLISRAGP